MPRVIVSVIITCVVLCARSEAQEQKLIGVTTNGVVYDLTSLVSGGSLGPNIRPWLNPTGGNIHSLAFANGLFYATMQDHPITTGDKSFLISFGLNGDSPTYVGSLNYYSAYAMARAPTGEVYVSLSPSLPPSGTPQPCLADHIGQIDLETGEVDPESVVQFDPVISGMECITGLAFTDTGDLLALFHKSAGTFPIVSAFAYIDPTSGAISPLCSNDFCWWLTSAWSEPSSLFGLSWHPGTGQIMSYHSGTSGGFYEFSLGGSPNYDVGYEFLGDGNIGPMSTTYVPFEELPELFANLWFPPVNHVLYLSD